MRRRFTGWFIPAHIVELLENGILSTRAMLLLSHIESLDQGDGCYASNSKLGEIMKLSPQRVSKLVAELSKIGLVKVVRTDGRRRFIRTTIYKELNVENLKKGGGQETTTLVRRRPGSLVSDDQGSLLLRNKAIKQHTVAHGRNGGFGLDKDSTSKIFKRFSSQLLKSLQSKRMVMRKPSISQWTKHFRQLHEKHKVPTVEIQTVLDWYCDNVGGKYVPRCYSAKSFCDRFDQLYNASQWNQETLVDENEVVELNEKEQDVVNELRRKGWPAKAQDQLPKVVHESIANHTSVKRRMARLLRIAENKVDQGSAGVQTELALEFLRQLMASYSGSVESWVEHWLLRVHSSVKNWKQWSGELHPYTASLHSKQYIEYHRNLCLKWCGDTKAWEFIFKKLRK